MLKRIITWAVVIFIGFYLIVDPSGVLGVAHGLLDLLKNAGNSLAGFFHSL